MRNKKADIIDWDVPVWSKTISFWEKYLPISGHGKKVLELAANKGGLSLFFADKGYNVICSDIKDPKLLAQSHHNQCTNQNMIRYEVVNALEIPFADNTFDIVTFKSFLGYLSIDQRTIAIAEIYRIIKPGGLLLFAENLEGSYLHKWARRSFIQWGKDWNYLSLEGIHKLLNIFSTCSFKTNGFISIFIRSDIFKKLVGPFDNLISCILPANIKYALFGVAIK